MKTEKELREIAQKVYFGPNPGLSAMIATEDGQFFYPDAVNAARSHARSQNCKTFVFEPKDPGNNAQDGNGQGNNAPPLKEYPQSAKKTIAAIKAAKTPDELVAVFNTNKIDQDDRTTVIDAYRKAAESLSVEVTKTGEGEPAPKTDNELLDLINAVTTEEQLDKLEAEYNLSKHPDAAIVEAFEAKETAFLN